MLKSRSVLANRRAENNRLGGKYRRLRVESLEDRQMLSVVTDPLLLAAIDPSTAVVAGSLKPLPNAVVASINSGVTIQSAKVSASSITANTLARPVDTYIDIQTSDCTYGQTMSIVADVKSLWGIPEGPMQGAVTFYSDGILIDSQPVYGHYGVSAACMVSFDHAGRHQISAVFDSSNNSYGPTSASTRVDIARAIAVVLADDRSMVVGSALPKLTASYPLGLVNGDSEHDFTTPLTLSTTATSAIPPGTYPITVGGATSPDYIFQFFAGTLTITTPEPSTIVLACMGLGGLLAYSWHKRNWTSTHTRGFKAEEPDDCTDFPVRSR